MRYPEFLKKGDKIVFTALSKGVAKSDKEKQVRYAKGIENFKEEGFKVEVQEHCFKDRLGRSASAKIRGHRFMNGYLDDESKMVLNICGGDFQCETLPYINYKKIKESTPKWVQGYSDTTHITFLLPTLCDVASVYAGCLGEFSNYSLTESARDNFDLLEGKQFVFHSYKECDMEREVEDPLAMPVYKSKVEWKALKGEKEINISGRLIGGCLDVIHTLVGTKYDKVRQFIHKYKEDGIIWFLETFSSNYFTFIGELYQLKNAGYFKNCKGIVFGRPLFYDKHKDNFEYHKIIKSVLGKLNIPIIYDADIGHVKPMIPLVCGSVTTFNYKEGKCKIKTEFK